MIDKNSSTPIYTQIEEIIIKNIQSAKWKKGTKIPSENNLMKEFQASRGTIKRAISNLVEQGKLIQKQGLGTFVVDDTFSFPLSEGLHSFSEYMKSQNINFSTNIVSIKLLPISEKLSKILNVEKDSKYLELIRTREINDETVMLIINNINLNVFESKKEIDSFINEDFINKSLFNLIEKHSKSSVAYSETRFAAVSADKKTSLHLSTKLHSPLLYQEQIVHLENNEIVEMAQVWLKSNKFCLGTIMQRAR